jgi:UDP-glucuronate 4-epimerase
MAVLVTGAAGFIGMHVARALLERGETVVGADNLHDYYDPALKRARLATLEGRSGFAFERVELSDREAVFALFDAHPGIDRIVHLAAQAGVRYSLIDPYAYVRSNVMGHLVMMEAARRVEDLRHFVYASSSSVYGGNEKLPFAVGDRVDDPVSLYAATKRSDELMSACYARLYGLPATGLRFFTVYGPWGRPDMSPFIFTKKIIAGEPIDVFNHGRHARDFTYIDDITEGVVRTMDSVAAPDPAWDSAAPDPATSSAPYRIYNIGNHQPVPLMTYIETIERAVGKEAKKNFLPMQPGDVPETYADVDDLARDVGFRPSTPLDEGIPRFVAWYRDFYGV